MFGAYYRAYLCQKFHMSTNNAYYYLISGIYFLFYLCFYYTKKSVLEYKMCISNIFYCIVNTHEYYEYVNDDTSKIENIYLKWDSNKHY
jgi:hypothetical protein